MKFDQTKHNPILKITPLFLFLIFFSAFSYAQDYKYASEVKLQKKALELLVDTIKTKYNKIIKKDTIFILTERFYSSRLPGKINGINICYMNSDDTKKQQRDSVFVISMSPLKTNPGETLDVEFSLYYVTLRLQTKYLQDSKDMKVSENYYDELYHDCGAGGIATFKFDCNANDYSLWHFSFSLGYCSGQF
jgi:hypothetical protein